MKINIMAVLSRNETVIFFRQQADYSSGALQVVCFNFTALNSRVVFQLPYCRIKGITYGYINILIGLFVMMFPANDQFFTRSSEINTDMVLIALMVAVVLGFHRNPATHNMRMESIQLAYFFTDSRFYSVRMGYSAKSNL
jgi:hypothetical protein